MFHLTTLRAVTEGSQGSNSEQEHGGRNRCRDHRRTLCCLLGCSACFFIQFRTTCPGVVPYTVVCALLHQSLINTMPHRLSYKQYDGSNPSVQIPSSQMILTLCHIEKQNKKSTGLFLLVETLGKETQQEEVSNHMGPEGIFSQPPSLPPPSPSTVPFRS